jgi:hypothetical protein
MLPAVAGMGALRSSVANFSNKETTGFQKEVIVSQIELYEQGCRICL